MSIWTSYYDFHFPGPWYDEHRDQNAEIVRLRSDTVLKDKEIKERLGVSLDKLRRVDNLFWVRFEAYEEALRQGTILEAGDALAFAYARYRRFNSVR